MVDNLILRLMGHLLIPQQPTCKYLGVHLDPALNLETHFNKTYKKAAGRVNLLRRIRSSIDLLSAERIYMPVFTYCGSTGLGWSDTHKRLIGNIERRSLTIIAPNSSNHSADLRVPSVDSILKRSACLFVFNCLHGNVCNPFKDYFVKTNHALNTRNNHSSVRLSRMKLEIGRQSFYFLAALCFNSLPLDIRKQNSRILFRKQVNEHSMCYRGVLCYRTSLITVLLH